MKKSHKIIAIFTALVAAASASAAGAFFYLSQGTEPQQPYWIRDPQICELRHEGSPGSMVFSNSEHSGFRFSFRIPTGPVGRTFELRSADMSFIFTRDEALQVLGTVDDQDRMNDLMTVLYNTADIELWSRGGTGPIAVWERRNLNEILMDVLTCWSQ